MRVWTIGHSNHPWLEFVALLRRTGITALADVRSTPRSRFAQFNARPMKERLESIGIEYLYLGETLGGRPATSDTPDYEAMARDPEFSAGLAEVESIAERARVALMCSEHEPLTCHRCLLIGRRLTERGGSVEHILRDGVVERHEDTERRLLNLTQRKTNDLFVAPEDRLVAAYRAQAATLQRKAGA